MLQAVECRERVVLRQRRHPPGADRRTDEFDAMHAWQPVACEHAVEGQERESLGTAGGGGHARDVFGLQSVALDAAAGLGAEADIEQVEHGLQVGVEGTVAGEVR
ncbi:MAG TPA: hypothetical protein VFX81_09995 [Burkholderiaceae bacterium]|nr:hypothetical protein [Burkholderiaceae bacterium]